MELFPIMVSHRHTNTTEYIPLDVISSHEQQASKNHGQTLQRLAERGGLSYCEALAVLEDRAWARIEQDEARLKVIEHIRTFNRQPTVDAVPVVRCGECIHYSFDRCKNPDIAQYTEDGVAFRDDNDFCSYGERREQP